MRDNIYLVVGCSGVGKTTIVNQLCSKYNLKSVESYTTREPRFDREQGHTFISENEFDNLENIIAYTKFNGFRYCATAEQIDNADFYVVDLSGVETFKNLYKGEKRPSVIYLAVDENIRKQRMIERGDTSKKAEERIRHDKKAFANYKDVFGGIEFYEIDCSGDIEGIVKNIYENVLNRKE